MEALKASSYPSFPRPPTSRTNPRTLIAKPVFQIPSKHQVTSSPPIAIRNPNFKVFTAIFPTATSADEIESENKEEKFDWYAHWYPVIPISDLDKRRPHGKKVMGLDIVIWWDRNENAWKVFDDSCPHRLAPLSEGRIDQWGRLQCVYHGWCFGGSGDCKLIPQAPRDGPPVKNDLLERLVGSQFSELCLNVNLLLDHLICFDAFLELQLDHMIFTIFP